ncbi:hypothetical protein JCM17960_14790 [Magnetospira thiophila]
MREALKSGVAVLAVFGLLGCSEVDLVNSLGASYDFAPPYTEQATQALAAADWQKAETREILFLESGLKPPFLYMKKGQPYLLRVVNTEESPRTLSGVDFFRNAAATGLTGSDEPDPLKVVSFSVAPKETREIHVVPMAAGRYRFNDATDSLYMPVLSQFSIGSGSIRGIAGVFVVSE